MIFRYYFSQIAKRDVSIYFKEQYLLISFPFLNTNKIFFVNDQYTIQNLASALEIEESSPVEIDLGEGTSLTPSSNLLKYILKDQSNKPIKFFQQEYEFRLIPAYQYKEAQYVKNQISLQYSPLPKYKEMVQQNVDPSHCNTLAWLLNQINPSDNLTEQTINKSIANALKILKSPVRTRLYDIRHEINKIESEITRLLEIREFMKIEAEKKGYLWLWGIFGLSLAQISVFYYGIYMVEEWGWDVMEPYSYTCQCLTVLLGMLFYVRFKQSRDISTIRDAFFFKTQKKSRDWRERWVRLNNLIDLKQEQQNQLESQWTIYHNRMNYHYYVQELKRN